MNFKKIFNRVNLTKIFIVGFLSRFLVNYFADVNVFVDYTNYISIIYYACLSFFIVFINDVVSYFQLSLFPSFKSIILLFNYLPEKAGIQYIDIHSKDDKLSIYFNYNKSVRQIIIENSKSDFKFKDRTRRFIHWYVWEQHKNNSGTYKDFKNNWDPDIKVYKLKLIVYFWKMVLVL